MPPVSRHLSMWVKELSRAQHGLVNLSFGMAELRLAYDQTLRGGDVRSICAKKILNSWNEPIGFPTGDAP